jgi:hypothetical protein
VSIRTFTGRTIFVVKAAFSSVRKPLAPRRFAATWLFVPQLGNFTERYADVLADST